MGRHVGDHYPRMVAAYVIGYGITPDYLRKNPHLCFAQSAADTGVTISYNTEAPNVAGKSLVCLEGQLAINPINWKRTGEYAAVSENLGVWRTASL